MSKSDHGIEITVESQFIPEQSAEDQTYYFFAYHIKIQNKGEYTTKLLSRHWIITNGKGEVEEVRGVGVVGKQPILKSGDQFAYTSACPLNTPMGVMKGTYQMINEKGERFDVEIPSFSLKHPKMLIH